jgi:hypothetical protein
MGQRNVRVVVGQGDLDRAGSLRAMLERDGFDVVGDASSTSQLARILTDERPDIVVLDDMIGVGAVEVATEIVPDARLVVVWPAAVMPIGGAVRVEPSEVATTLTATVALAAGLSGLGAIDRPEWIERVKKDPATLREMLAAGGSLPARPSVTELQRRGHRLHPSPAASTRAARSTDAAAVVPIGLAAAVHEDDESAAAAAVATVPLVVESRWNRRLGVVSLASAAAAGAVMIALALGGGRAPSIVSAEPFPLIVSHGGGPAFGTDGRNTNPDGNGGTTPNGGGQTGPGSGGGTAPNGSIHVLGGGSGTAGGSGTGSGSATGSGSTGGGTGGSPGGAGTPGGPRSSASHLPGAHGSGRTGGAPGQTPVPGGSGDHNPHGGPPGHSPGHGGNPHGNGNGNGHRNGGRSGSHGKSANAHSHKR